jgi:hypothetical protein
MNTQHTPGPWRIGAYESGQMAVDGANGEQVTGFIAPSDAILIAAAPELLEALRNIVSASLRHGLEESDFVVEQARAAIAKATGVKP